MLKSVVAGTGMFGVIVLMMHAATLERTHDSFISDISDGKAASVTVHLLAVGDINLGREVGQRILSGDLLYPFQHVRDTFVQYDVVFANLECQLSDQQGETQHPKNNLLFTGPPEGAASLREGGITLVSTANNHALDYGFRAHAETMANLSVEGILFAGTATNPEELHEPALFEAKGVRFALFACTDLMNIEDTVWRRYVAYADTGRLLPRIRAHRPSADFIIVSYHGGVEYQDRPTWRTREFARAAIESGADLFLGHHPHVPQGLDEIGGKPVVYSLGNLVFNQPFQFWTQRSFAFRAEIVKSNDGAKVIAYECLPVACGNQPRFIVDDNERSIVMERLRRLSSESIAAYLN